MSERGTQGVKILYEYRETNMRIIPAIDLINGKCVRLEKGDYNRKTEYREDPLEVAKEFEDAGLQYLHLVDLDGAKAGTLLNWKVLERICANTALTVDVGGGIKSDDDLRIALDCGATQVNVGSLAVKNPEQFRAWLQDKGGDVMILSADVRDSKIAVSGWQEQTDIALTTFIEGFLKDGLKTVVTTDISRDGMLTGPSIELYHQLRTEFPDLDFVASGGVSNLSDLEDLATIGMGGAILGKAIYEGRITLEDLAVL